MYILVPGKLVQSCAHLLSALFRTPRAALTVQINNKVWMEKSELGCKTGNVSTVRLASLRAFICPKLNIATADIHVLKRDIYLS